MKTILDYRIKHYEVQGDQIIIGASFLSPNFSNYVDQIYVTFTDIAYHQRFCNLQIVNAEKPRIGSQDEEKGKKGIGRYFSRERSVACHTERIYQKYVKFDH